MPPEATVRVTGGGGHGALPAKNGAMAGAGRLLDGSTPHRVGRRRGRPALGFVVAVGELCVFVGLADLLAETLGHAVSAEGTLARPLRPRLSLVASVLAVSVEVSDCRASH